MIDDDASNRILLLKNEKDETSTVKLVERRNHRVSGAVGRHDERESMKDDDVTTVGGSSLSMASADQSLQCKDGVESQAERE
jgi:hypothetical protein